MVEEAEAGDVRGEKNTRPFSQAELDRLIADIDTNNDQKVSYKEFEDRWLADRETEITKEGEAATNLKTLLDAGSGQETSGTNSIGPEAPALPGLIQVSEDARLRRERAEEAGEARWWWSPAPTVPPPMPKDPKAGNVAALYTYGAPGTAKKPLKNDLRHDGCFPGARVYTSSRVSGWFYGFYYKSDPVAWLATHNHVWPATFLHAKMNILELKDWELGQPSLHRCSHHTTYWPERDYYYATSLHTLSPGPYERGVNNQQHYPTPRTVLHHAALAYLTGDAVTAKASSTARNVVASVVVGHDAAYLLQDPSNKECTLTFKGSDSFGIDSGDWINNVGQAIGVDFCGFEGVHKGFKTELLGLLQAPAWEGIKSKLPKCAALLATGHSLGGAQAELFSACANRAPAEGYPGHSDYKLLSWKWDTPEVLSR